MILDVNILKSLEVINVQSQHWMNEWIPVEEADPKAKMTIWTWNDVE